MYDPANPPVAIAQGLSGGPTVWHYASADAHGDVDATDYFTGAKVLGMKVGDVVFVINTSGYTVTTHAVSAVDADGNVTVSAAVLA